jgi:integrase
MYERERGVWTLRVELPTRDGKRRWKATTFRGNKTNARASLRKLVEEVEKKYQSRPINQQWTFQLLFEEWIEGLSLTTENPRSSTTTYQERRRYERHIAPEFGERLVETVERDEFKRFYNKLRRSRVVNGETRKGLSSTSVARIHEQMRAMCAWGVDRSLISHNPLRDVKRPRITLPNPQPPDYEELDMLLQRLWRSDRRLWIAVRVAATTGARRSELVALRWRDIVFTGRGAPAIQIERGLTYVPGVGLVQTDTKTGVTASARISIDNELMEVLKSAWIDFIELNGVGANGYIFSDDPGGEKPWHPDTFSARLRRQVDVWGPVNKRRRITFKSLRSYLATELQVLGNDAATAQAVLRHKSPLTTQRHYAAARERKMRGATVKVGEQFTKRGYTKPAD